MTKDDDAHGKVLKSTHGMSQQRAEAKAKRTAEGLITNARMDTLLPLDSITNSPNTKRK